MIKVKSIIGYEDHYTVDEFGNVFSLKRNRQVKLQTDKDGYIIISLCKNNKRKKYKVHRLVAEHFFEKFNKNNHINHLDFNKKNNHYSNLEECNTIQNNSHKGNKGQTKRYGICKSYIKKDGTIMWSAVIHKSKRSDKNIKDIYLGVSSDKEELYERFYEAFLMHHGIPPWNKDKFKKD